VNADDSFQGLLRSRLRSLERRLAEPPAIRRPYVVVDEIGPEAQQFWDLSSAAPTGRAFPPRRLGGADGLSALRVRHFRVDHSIHGAAAIAVETSAGWIVYTGDLRRHGAAGELTRAFIKEAAGLAPAALVCEGTNIDREPGPSEDQVFEACLGAVTEAEGRLVVAGFGPRNVERLLCFLEIARRTRRRLLVPEKDAYLLTAMRAVDPAIPTPATEPVLKVYRRALNDPSAWTEHVRARYPDQATAAQVRRDPGAQRARDVYGYRRGPGAAGRDCVDRHVFGRVLLLTSVVDQRLPGHGRLRPVRGEV